MRPRKVDLAFEWMRGQEQRPLHYRDDVWTALAALHPDEFGQSEGRKTPWYSLHRDMSQDPRFVRGERGMFELVSSALNDTETAESDAMPVAKSTQAWIFQANPKFYRILEALQSLDRMQFLTNRYKDRIQVGDVVLLWMSGKYAGVYAEARVIEGVEERSSEAADAAFWADPKSGATAKPRVVLEIERRFLGNPLLKATIAETKGLEKLMILRQPNGTNFRVDPEEWELLRPLLPEEETVEPDRKVLTWAMKRARGGKLYDDSCGELLERFVAETFADGEEHSRDEITSWFAENYPLFKPITVQCHVEKYTTNFRSRVHYNATSDHDLLFRVDDDWGRLRLFRAGTDPAPIHERPPKTTSSKSKGRAKKKALGLVERNRRILHHLASYGELTPSDLDALGLDEGELGDWLDAMLTRRPGGYVVTPLFLHFIEGDPGPQTFTTRLAARFMGEHLRRHTPEPIPELEEHVWERFGRWHLTQPHAGDPKVHAYLGVPLREARDVAASERLDLFAQLPPKVIGDLIREPDFLAEQQSWSADAASKTTEGPLSSQLRRNWRRPLFLATAEVPLDEDGHEVPASELAAPDLAERMYVVAGLPLRPDSGAKTSIARDIAVERLLLHPVAAAVVQFDVHRMFAGLSGDSAATLIFADGSWELHLDGVSKGALWRHVRKLVELVGYQPVGASTVDALWAPAVNVMVANLERLQVLERVGDTLRLTEDTQSQIKAHPGHPQNRGEKAFRIRLSQFLAALQGGQA
ncbi:MAG: EVE domain-containing protein [Acidobacteriota bacterium]